MRELTRTRQARSRPLPARRNVVIIISALPVRIVRNRVAAHHAEGDRLRVEVRARGDEADLLHVVGVARHPVDDLQSAVAAADEGRELLDAELSEEHPEDVHRIVEGVLREGGTIGLAGVGVNGHRARRSAAPAEDVRADDVVAVRVDGTSGTDHSLPPAARLRLAGFHAGDVRIARQRMTDVDRIVSVQRCTALLVGDLDLLEDAAIGELQAAVRQIELQLLQFDNTNSVHDL